MLQSIEMPPQLLCKPVSEFVHSREEWHAIGLSTEPADRQMAEAAIHRIYRSARLDPPKKIAWCGSPLSQGLARTIVLDPEFMNAAIESVWEQAANPARTKLRDSVRDSFRSSVRLFDTGAVKRELVTSVMAGIRTAMTARILAGLKEEVRFTLSDSVWQSAWDGIWCGISEPLFQGMEAGIKAVIETSKRSGLEDAIRGCLAGHVGDAVKSVVWDKPMETAWGKVRNSIDCKMRVRAWDELWGPLQIGVWEKVAFAIGGCVKQITPDSPHASGYGQHDAYWLAFYDYFRAQEGLNDETDDVTGLMDLARSAGWFVPHEHICWVCERPLGLSFDQEGKLHAAEGPAVAYPDGWSLYGTHGILRLSAGGK